MCNKMLVTKGLHVASFPGLPHPRFLIACSMQKRVHTASNQKLEAGPGKAWERGYSLHVQHM